ncbi:MAG: glycosyltransferase involved in cell wall biosynthesis [Maribacter sp.]|jgi:glycosyltransferase involved in cell wall biosynthesis
MKILFLTDNFPPESNAPATRTYEHCMEWLKKGADITVITCAPNYPKGEVFPGYKNKWYQKENMDGIKVIRVWSYITPNRGLIRRILDYISFCISAFTASLFVKTDIIIATSPQLFTAVAGYFASIFKRKPWIMEVRDLWPESIKAVGAIEQSKILDTLDKLVIFLYKKATSIVVVTDSFKGRIATCDVEPNKIHIVKNGVHLYKFQEQEKDVELMRKYQLEGKFIIAYIGTHGMAHKLDFILDCAKEVKNKQIHFLFVGAGAMKTRLVKQVEDLGLDNVTMVDAVPKNEVTRYISLSDVALIPLRKKDTFKTVLPSKIFENAAMVKPILLGVEGEAEKVVKEYHAGLCFEPENKTDFLAKLDEIYQNKEQYNTLKKGCMELAKVFDRKTLADKMYQIIEITKK